MTNHHASKSGRFHSLQNTTAVFVIGAALGLFSIGASAQGSTTSPAPFEMLAGANPADLEDAFWACDYAATNNGVDGNTAITCGMVTESLKVKKFNGDFDSMLAWWRQNRSAKHQTLATSSRPTSSR